MQQHPLRVATQAGLWLVALAAALLAAVGFGVHATVTLRARAVEFAQLRAIGLSRRSLTAVVGAESLLLCLLGGAFGIGIGALLGWLVGPLVAVSADGTPAGATRPDRLGAGPATRWTTPGSAARCWDRWTAPDAASPWRRRGGRSPVSYTHLRAHETDSYLVCR